MDKNKQLIEKLIINNIIKSPKVEEIMLSIDRGDFTQNNKYLDEPQWIGYNSTISAPHMHAHTLELLKDNIIKANKILDIGSGSGYLTLAFAKMMTNGICYGIEHIPELINFSINNINKNHKNYIEEGKIQIIKGDGILGLPEHSPYDVIHVGAASENIPTSLIKQLNIGGILILPVGKKGHQEFTIIKKKNDGEYLINFLFGVNYVPLTSKNIQLTTKNKKKFLLKKKIE